MKRIMAFLVAVLMIISLTACGANKALFDTEEEMNHVIQGTWKDFDEYYYVFDGNEVTVYDTHFSYHKKDENYKYNDEDFIKKYIVESDIKANTICFNNKTYQIVKENNEYKIQYFEKISDDSKSIPEAYIKAKEENEGRHGLDGLMEENPNIENKRFVYNNTGDGISYYSFETSYPYGKRYDYYRGKQGGLFSNWEVDGSKFIRVWYNPNGTSEPYKNNENSYYFVSSGFLVSFDKNSDKEATVTEDNAITYYSNMGVSNGSYIEYKPDGTINTYLKYNDGSYSVGTGNYYCVAERIFKHVITSTTHYLTTGKTFTNTTVSYELIDFDGYKYDAYIEY